MNIDDFLARLEKVKKTGPDRWRACCPGHDDKQPSLSIRVTEDTRILVHCWAGCSVYEITAGAGVKVADLMPPRPLTSTNLPPERHPFLLADAFKRAMLENGVIAVIASDMYKHRAIGEDDYQRLWQAVDRLSEILRSVYGR
jgi:hypothetical protein